MEAVKARSPAGTVAYWRFKGVSVDDLICLSFGDIVQAGDGVGHTAVRETAETPEHLAREKPDGRNPREP